MNGPGVARFAPLYRIVRAQLFRHRHALSAMLAVAMFVVALAVLHRELATVSLGDVRAALGQVSGMRLSLALASMAASYLALSGYDFLAFRYLGWKLSFRRVLPPSFVANAVAHNVGVAMLSGGAIRLRLYTRMGLSAAEVAGLMMLLGLTFGVGLTFVTGAVLLAQPEQAGRLLHIAPAAARWSGAVAVAVVGGYFSLALFRREEFRLRRWRLRIPAARLAFGQLLLAVIDLGCAAAVLYWLLPVDASPPYAAFLSVYVIAVIAGIVSHVPGGLGVFETVLLLGLPDLPREGLLAAILAYRGIYFVLPLVLAAMIAAGVLGGARPDGAGPRAIGPARGRSGPR